jgi:hypothetical protein
VILPPKPGRRSAAGTVRIVAALVAVVAIAVPAFPAVAPSEAQTLQASSSLHELSSMTFASLARPNDIPGAYASQAPAVTADGSAPRAGNPGPSGVGVRIKAPTASPSLLANLIFADDFEASDLSAWSSTTGKGLSLTADASMAGKQGLLVTVAGRSPSFVTADSAKAERRYRARFYFNPNSISMPNGSTHSIFVGSSRTSTRVARVLRVELGVATNQYRVRAALVDDGSAWLNTAWSVVDNAAHPIEVDWQAATSPAAHDGHLTLWIDDVERASLTGVANDRWWIDRIQLGAVEGVDGATRGTYYFDAFESRRQDYIGP